MVVEVGVLVLEPAPQSGPVQHVERGEQEEHLQPDGERLVDGLGNRCVFLQDGAEAGCGIYRARPRKCREWPFWPELRTDPELARLVLRTCPGIEPLDAGRAG